MRKGMILYSSVSLIEKKMTNVGKVCCTVTDGKDRFHYL